MEFKKLSDVDIVAEPAETANVLIEENGVIKKAPKTAVGGEEADLVIRINDVPSNQIYTNLCSIEEGSVEAVLNAVREERIPNIKLRFYIGSSDQIGKYYPLYCTEIIPTVYLYGEKIYINYVVPSGYDMYTRIFWINFDGFFGSDPL